MNLSKKSFTWYMVRWCSILSITFFIYCKSANRIPQSTSPVPDINHFNSFYDIFHRDSDYQLSHTLFPLEGVPEQNDTTYYNNGFKWQKENWVMHRTMNAKDTSFRREFNILDSTLIIENIFHTQSPMRMERRFSFNGDWSLIYYSPMRMPIEIN